MQYRMNLVLVALAAVAVLVGTAGFAQADLIAHWAFDEGTNATIADDQAGGTYDHNGTVDTTSGHGPTTGQPGKIGNAYLFSGYDPGNNTSGGIGGVEVPNASDLNTFTDVTLCGWLYMTALPSADRKIISKSYWSGSSTSESYFFGVIDTPKKCAGFFGGTSYNNAVIVRQDAAGYGDSNWHQLTVTYHYTDDLETAMLYLDGVYQSTATANKTGIATVDHSLFLGTGHKFSRAFDGKLDDLGIWDEVLADGKVGALYNVVEDLGLAYNLSDMKKLFDVYDTGTSDTVGGLTWEKDVALPGGHNDGDAWAAGGYYYVQLETGSAMGVKAAIPEPSTLLLLATGLLGLLAYAWRKRK